jgi:hypothetical protein
VITTYSVPGRGFLTVSSTVFYLGSSSSPGIAQFGLISKASSSHSRTTEFVLQLMMS